jgi:hypothetical protein
MIDLSDALRGVRPTAVPRPPTAARADPPHPRGAGGGDHPAPPGADLPPAAAAAAAEYRVRRVEQAAALRRSEDGPEAAGEGWTRLTTPTFARGWHLRLAFASLYTLSTAGLHPFTH